MSGFTQESQMSADTINPHSTLDIVRGLFAFGSLRKPTNLPEIPGKTPCVQYLMMMEPVGEREFVFENKRIILWVGDERDCAKFDFDINPKVPYVLVQDVAAGEDIMIINTALMGRTVLVPVDEEVDESKLEFSGPDYILSTIEAFVCGDIKYTYPGNY